MHHFVHFCFTDFHDSGQKYVIQCPRKLFRSKISNFSANGSLLHQKQFFVHFG